MRNKLFLAFTVATLAASGTLAIVACSSSSSSGGGGVDAGEDGEPVDDATADAPNLAENPSFEQSQAACAPPWQALEGSNLTTTTIGHVGSHACQICNLDPQKREVAVTVTVPIDPPTDGKVAFALSAFIRDVDGGAPDAGGNVGRLALVPRDAKNAPIAAGSSQVDVPIQSTSWRSFATSSTPKTTATQMEARVGGLVAPNGCIIVDDVVLYRTP